MFEEGQATPAPPHARKGLAQWLWQNVEFWVYVSLEIYERSDLARRLIHFVGAGKTRL